MNTADLVVIGGGVVGLTTALEVARRHPRLRITVLEKEVSCGAHASGRNSGVLHAGFYYTADSLKAKFCRDGNAALSRWCAEQGIPVNRCGKLVVPTREAEIAPLEELFRRAAANGVAVSRLTEDEARRIEPRIRPIGDVLWSPTTATVDPVRVLAGLEDEARRLGVAVRTGVAFTGRRGTTLETSAGPLDAGFAIGAAGLQADRVAAAWGFAEDYEILPFRGLYWYPDGPALACCVYPVPDLRLPFLGVHWTVDALGRAKIGPSALPGAWREQYSGLRRFSAGEFARITRVQLGQLIRDRAFRGLAWDEIGKWTAKGLLERAGRLVADPATSGHWGRVGVRAQLFDRKRRQLVMDFAVEGDDRSLHVLNAPSPAFTSAWPFAAWLVDRTPLR